MVKSNNGLLLWLGKYSSALPLMALALFVFGIYHKASQFSVFSLDDWQYVFDNPIVLNGLTFDGFINAFKFIDYTFWIPLTWISYMADLSFFGADPGALHRTSVVLFVVNVFLVYFFAKKIADNVFVALATALLFSVHPMRVESVAWIAQRKDLLSGIFYVLCLLEYLEYGNKGNKKNYYASIALAAASIMSKPSTVVLAPILILCDYWRLSQKGESARFGDVLTSLWPHVLLSFAGFAVTVFHRGSIILQYDILTRVKIFGCAMFYFIEKTFYPRDLALVNKDIQFAEVDGATALVAIFALAIIGAALFYYRKRAPDLFYGCLWYLIAILPSSGILPTGNVLWSDKFTFLPHIGLFLGMSLEVRKRVNRAADGKYRLYAAVALAASVGVLAFEANSYTAKWKDTSTYFNYVDSIYGKTSYSYVQRGIDSGFRGKIYESIEYFNIAERINPQDQEIYYSRAISFSIIGDFEMAIRDYRKALEMNPDDRQARHNLELLLRQLGGPR